MLKRIATLIKTFCRLERVSLSAMLSFSMILGYESYKKTGLARNQSELQYILNTTET